MTRKHRDFTAATHRALKKIAKAEIVGSVAVPLYDGDKYFGGVAYTVLFDDGRSRILRFWDVLALVGIYEDTTIEAV